MNQLERIMLAELKTVANNRKLKLDDIMEWSTTEIKPREGEVLYHLPLCGVWCCIKDKSL